MATEGGHTDFMFLGPPYLATESATEDSPFKSRTNCAGNLLN